MQLGQPGWKGFGSQGYLGLGMSCARDASTCFGRSIVPIDDGPTPGLDHALQFRLPSNLKGQVTLGGNGYGLTVPLDEYLQSRGELDVSLWFRASSGYARSSSVPTLNIATIEAYSKTDFIDIHDDLRYDNKVHFMRPLHFAGSRFFGRVALPSNHRACRQAVYA